MKVQTKAIHFSADQKLEMFIQRKIQKLERLFGRIMTAEVVMKLGENGKIRDKIVEVRLKVPGNVLVTKGKHKTFEAAFDKSLSTLKRQLIKYKEKIRR